MSKEYLIEFYWMGKYVKVSAIDPVTNTEISIVGDARAPKTDLEQLVIKKLEYVLAKNRNDKKND